MNPQQLQQKTNEIRLLIAEVEILSAIQEVIQLAETLGKGSLRDDAILLKVNQTKINEDRRKNLSSADELEIRQNRVIDQTLDIIAQLENAVSAIKPPTPPPTDTNIPETVAAASSFNKNWIWIGGTILLFLVALWVYNSFGEETLVVQEVMEETEDCEEHLTEGRIAFRLENFQKAKEELVRADELCEDEYYLEEIEEMLAICEQKIKEAAQAENPSKPANTNPSEGEVTQKPSVSIKPNLKVVPPPQQLLDVSRLISVWTGTWTTTYGEMRLIQKDNEVIGDYENGKGTIFGTFDEKNKTLKGDFFNNISQKQGDFEFIVDGKNFKGTWNWDNNAAKSTWTGEKTNTTTPLLKYYKIGAEGTITDATTKQPLGGVKVVFKNKVGHAESVATTDSRGNYRLFLTKGFYTVQLSKDGYQDYSSSRSRTISNWAKSDFSLSKK